MYTAYFGLSRQPFSGTDTETLFATRSFSAAWQCLRGGLGERRHLLLLLGAGGAGKTTLLRRLMREIEGESRCIFFWNAHLGFDDLLNYLCDDLDLRAPGTGRGEKIQALEVHLIARLAAGERLALVLDDAQNLPEETLEGLARLNQLETGEQRLLQIVLGARPELERRLEEEAGGRALAAGVDARCQLEPVDPEEAAAYVRQQLRMAGNEAGDLFEPEAVERVVHKAGGLPRLLNMIANQALLLAYLNSEARVKADLVREVSLAEGPPPAPPRPPPPEPAMKATRRRPPPPETPIIPRQPPPPPPPAAQPVEDAPSPQTLQRRHQRARHGFLALVFLTVVVTAALALHSPYLQVEVRVDVDRAREDIGRLQAVVEQRLSKLRQLPAVAALLQWTEDRSAPTPEAPRPPDTGTPRAAPGADLAPRPAARDEARYAPSRRVRTLLHQADQQMGVLRLVSPAGDNALASYRQVLALDPDNAEARQGIDRIKAKLLLWAGSARAQGAHAQAEEYLGKAVAIDPDDPEVHAELEALRAEMVGTSSTP